MGKRSSRDLEVLGRVRTPLSFFVLIVLVVETILLGSLNYARDSEWWLIIGLMLGMLFLLVLLVAGIAFYRPEALKGMRAPEAASLAGRVSDISGDWSITLRGSEGTVVRGIATVSQAANLFRVKGQVTMGGDYFISFVSLLGGIENGSLYFIYENTDRERGVAWGVLSGDRPDKVSLVYHDLVGFTRTHATGQMEFVRQG
jgi:hypothetical protein